ncbi:hypothetical protein [Clostridium paraputrificum]|uniref:hypothetical protein n=1 Tax=Clostridium paraputrificum TaxID=29363 RepID=UPI0026713631|nr:hypothetical protein [Clostridium paraputrificum]
MNKIKKPIEEFLEEIEGCCEQLSILYDVKKKTDKEYHIRLNKDNLIRVYNTQKGLNPDLSQLKDKEIGEKVLSFWEINYFKEVINGTYTYKKVKNINDDLDMLDEFAENNNCTVSYKRNNNPNVLCCKTIEDEVFHEKITIQLFGNKTLMLQGDKGVLWEKICNDIEKRENIIKSKDILNRISGNDEDIDMLYYESELKNVLTNEIYDFLSCEDREYLLCSQQLIMEEKQFITYTPVLCCAALALEGYLKTLLIKLGVIKVIEISKTNFNFGEIFIKNKFNPKKVKDIQISNNKKDLVVSELERIYRKVKAYRNPVCHSGAGVSPNTLKVKSFKRCKELYFKEYINTIKSTYDIIYR